MEETRNADGLGIASLVVGIISFFFYPIVVGFVAIILGVLNEPPRSGLAKSGMTLGVLSIIFGAIQILIMFS